MAFSKPKAHERAERYAARGQHDKAAREYQTIVEHDPKDVRAWLMLADCLVRCNDRAGAIERYNQVAHYYVEAKEYNKALAVYRQVLNLDNKRLDIQAKVAGLNLQLGRVQDGIALYERVAHAQMQMGRTGDALNCYRLVADADPKVVARRLRLAELYSREKRTAEAVEAFREAGEQLLNVGRLSDFVRVAERLLYHDEGDLPTIRGLARAYLELREPRRALMKLNGLLRANPKDERGIELLAETFMALGKPEKAISALEELARSLQAKGPSARDHTIRILRRGLQWRPGHAEFRDILLKLEGRRPSPTGPDDAEVLGLDDDDIDLGTIEDGELVEIDDDDLVLDEPSPLRTERGGHSPLTRGQNPSVSLPETASPAPGSERASEVAAIPSSNSSLTQSVLSEVAERRSVDTDDLTDFDKILFEARVYIKYRLFEHAFDHLQTALQQQPSHVGALSLQARALTELGRSDQAAGIHLRVAQLVENRDPKLAREHAGAARSLSAEYPADRNTWESSPDIGDALTKIPASLDDDLGDSGAFDVVAGEVDDLIVDARNQAPADPVAQSNLDDDELDSSATQPFTPKELQEAVLFGGLLSGEDRLASGREIDIIDVEDEDEDGQQPPTEGKPGIGTDDEPAGRPELIVGGAEELSLDTLDIEFEDDTSARLKVGVPADLPPGESDRTELELSTGEVEDDEDFDPADLALALEDLVDDSLKVELNPSSEPEAAAEPEVVGFTDPDLSDDLAETRFYIDQGLEDDAEAALRELEAQYPGHPQIAAFRASVGLGDQAAGLVEAEAAEPLVSLDLDDEAPSSGPAFDEDEDEDAYLSAIFADPSEQKARASSSSSSAGANVAEGQAVDAQTAFDLGVAYREMGLVDAAIEQFSTAAGDAQWRARALTMIGTLRIHRGETDQAITDLNEAVGLASTPDESSEAAYELGVLYEMMGNTPAAIEQLLHVAPGYRERDDLLQRLVG